MAKPPRATLTQIERGQLQFLMARFDTLQPEGVSALKRGDFRAAERALRVQRDILDQQRALILVRIIQANSA